MKFENLIQSIQQTHPALQQYVNKAINRSLTIRNWLIGFHIVQFEQKGEDREIIFFSSKTSIAYLETI